MGLGFRLFFFFFSVAPHKVSIRCSLRIGTSQEAVREEVQIELQQALAKAEFGW